VAPTGAAAAHVQGVAVGASGPDCCRTVARGPGVSLAAARADAGLAAPGQPAVLLQAATSRLEVPETGPPRTPPLDGTSPARTPLVLRI
jgi:hypothetical protein